MAALMRRRAGQSMTEYIIIVALIAIAAIAAFSYFGQSIRGQVSVMTQEMTGVESPDKSAVNEAQTGATSSAVTEKKTLSNYSDQGGGGGGGDGGN